MTPGALPLPGDVTDAEMVRKPLALYGSVFPDAFAGEKTTEMERPSRKT